MISNESKDKHSVGKTSQSYFEKRFLCEVIALVISKKHIITKSVQIWLYTNQMDQKTETGTHINAGPWRLSEKSHVWR